MNILVVGGGGREHVIIKKLRENDSVDTIYALPGNGGIAQDAECADIAATDIEGIVRFAKEHPVDFVVVAPDDPLVLGAVDALEGAGFRCFGPNARAAQIEGSKIFAKELMKKYGIPTADFAVFDDAEEALRALGGMKYPLVVKADGLALGKGVIICNDISEAEKAVTDMMRARVFGESGARVVVEECLQGPEVSVLAFADGKTVVPMVSSMDHKRALDNDLGKNTGGMGAIAPNPLYTKEVARYCEHEIFRKTIEAMNAEGRPFKGCLFFGLMLTEDGPKVIEYNCRFGDPEAQVVLPLLKTDLLTIMQSISDGTLGEMDVEFYDAAACCVIVASGGYPEKYEKGFEISLGRADEMEDVRLYHAGTRLEREKLVTSGGRVLGVTAIAEDLPEAILTAYRAASEIEFEGAYCRRDIGKRALAGGM